METNHPQRGLEWVLGTFGWVPQWTIQPDPAVVELLARRHLKIAPEVHCQVTFHAEGAFNKLFKITTDANDFSFLLRVALPVDPFNKTNSEVATLQFVHKFTEIPSPRIFAFNDSADNELGFEWILMEMLPGVSLRERWRFMSEDAKRGLVKSVAKYQTQLFDLRFSGIGNLFVDLKDSHFLDQLHTQTASDKDPMPASDLETEQKTSHTIAQLRPLGQMVSLAFFWGDRLQQDVPRGPFNSSEEWIRARLALVLADQEQIISATSSDEDDIEEAEEVKLLANQLLGLIPHFFPSVEAEESVLFHDDLSMQNILVDNDGKITGVVDWECVSALPLWRACTLPEFLKGRDRAQIPKLEEYSPDHDDPNNQGVDGLYWEHLLEYELTYLRAFFKTEMECRAPTWIEEMEKEELKVEFDEAVQNCDNNWGMKKVKDWVTLQIGIHN
ncbi:hypothetical protein IFR05_008938 [Cadophora sp. M221]|nr:hypothetical protein IFR05_008938 [Cadophora sp. M221]